MSVLRVQSPPWPPGMSLMSNGRYRHARVRVSVTALLIKLVLVFSLLVAEPLEAWGRNADGPVTPEQWSRHTLDTEQNRASDLARNVGGDIPRSESRPVAVFTDDPISSSGLVPSEPVATLVSRTPDGPWRVVARWQSLGPATTEEFAVTSPWRIRWRLQADDEPFVAMLYPDHDDPILLNGGEAVVAGAFHIGPAGTFSLAVHTQVPWEVSVEDLGPEERGTPR